MLEYTKTILQVWIVEQRHREKNKMYDTKTLILFIIGGILLGFFVYLFYSFSKTMFFLCSWL
jgi:hypothetical protein